MFGQEFLKKSSSLKIKINEGSDGQCKAGKSIGSKKCQINFWQIAFENDDLLHDQHHHEEQTTNVNPPTQTITHMQQVGGIKNAHRAYTVESKRNLVGHFQTETSGYGMQLLILVKLNILQSIDDIKTGYPSQHSDRIQEGQAIETPFNCQISTQRSQWKSQS